MSRLLIFVAFLVAFVAALIGFDVISNPHALGFLGAALAVRFAADLVP